MPDYCEIGHARQVSIMNPAETTNLLRLAADEELTAEQAIALEAHLAAHPEDLEFVAFERRLRAAVGRAMGDVAVPTELRAAVQAQLSAPAHSLRLAGDVAPAASAVGAGSSRRRWFVPSGLAAGFLLLVGVAVVIGVMGRSDWFDWFRSPQINISNEGGSLGFPIQEHQRCITDASYARRKFTIHTQDALARHLAKDLRWDVTIPDLSPFGYVFEDAGNCNVGGGSVESVHLRYVNDSTTVSVWIERSRPSDLTHSATFEEGHAYFVTPTDRRALPDGQSAYYAWRSGDFVYRIVPGSAGESRAMAVSVGMPDVTPEQIH